MTDADTIRAEFAGQCAGCGREVSRRFRVPSGSLNNQHTRKLRCKECRRTAHAVLVDGDAGGHR